VDIGEFEAWWSANMEAWLAQASAEAVGRQSHYFRRRPLISRMENVA
jgi:hypothetical protein